jgi:hypothetical protein
MVTIRTVAVHDVVAAAYPRESKESDLTAMAIGKAIDATLSHLSHEARVRRPPTVAAIRSYGASTLDEALDEAGVDLSAAEREATLTEMHEVAQAFRKSVLLGLPRPRSRLVLIGERVGVYAQPDYWDGRDRFYEMKSYLAVPLRPEVALQLRLFQLAFPGFTALLVCIDRHAHPVATTTATIPPPTLAETADALRLAAQVAETTGRDRVLQYVDAPIVRYGLPPPNVAAPVPEGPRGS